MANIDIPSARSDLIDPHTPGKISREWYMFLYKLANSSSAGGGEDETVDISGVAVHAAEDANKALLSAFEAQLPQQNPETLKRIAALEMDNGWPHARQSDVGQINQRLQALELDDGWPYANKSDVKQVNQRISDLEVTVAMAAGGGGGLTEDDVTELITDTVDAVYIESAGYWSPLTNGDPVTPELIWDSNGDVISLFTPTP